MGSLAMYCQAGTSPRTNNQRARDFKRLFVTHFIAPPPVALAASVVVRCFIPLWFLENTNPAHRTSRTQRDR